MINIALIGFMGSGKSQVGEALGLLLGAQAVDIDRNIELEAGRSVREIFVADGEVAFRKLEKAAIAAASRGGGKVISCGGGAVLDPENVRRLKEGGVVVLLTGEPQTLYERVKDEGTRPLLDGPTGSEGSDDRQRRARFRELLKAREPVYRAAADLTVDTTDKTPEQAATEIATWLEETGRRD